MSNEIDVNDIVPLLDPATEIGDEIFRGNGMFADEEGYKAPSQNGGIYDDIDGLEMPEYFDEDTGETKSTELEDLSNEWDENDNVEDLTANYEDDADNLDSAFYKIGEERVEREKLEVAYKAFSDMEARQTMLQDHVHELGETQAELDKFHDLAVLQLDEDIYSYRTALESGRLNPTDYQEYSMALKQLERNKSVIENKYQENTKRLEADKARAEKIRFRDTVMTLKHKQGWTDSDFNEVTQFVNNSGINLKISDISPVLFTALRKAVLFDKNTTANKQKHETRVQKAVAGKPVRETKTPVPNTDAKRKANALRAISNGDMSFKDAFKYIED
ncbi:TPA: hypothetical protein ACN7B3_005232 [Klebsiella pneumoniae]|uniref:hypothetical protein n=1 Tax=Klebsiella pneumoniae TaxID=573 RepID=UPI000E2CAED2|nr:hypothetical protein [Klebsiella pneumoniae]MBC4676294.1 hypothetical protein [Klebsiella pneumoniae]MBX4492379.1 hypothetical protein [Klebsiella pneumoniae]MBX4494562.1 hypothetical protein [Klebsiella pneumoniae]MBX4681665.1 hypothetical protein [Klebsiella pneumoniae]MBZ1994394.1 hypothetical protein [Klebsiella pneumoniae]